MAWGTRSEMDQQRRYARTRTLLAFFGLILLVLAARLLYLQVFRYDETLRLSEKNRMRMRTIVAERGRIYDRFGEPLVRNRASWQVMITRADMTNPDSLKERLLSLRFADGAPVFDSALVSVRFEQSRWRNKYGSLRVYEDAPPEGVPST